jgi:adenosylcobyric acid synthase
MAARFLMVQGSSSSAGKSLLVTALCRIYARRGMRVAPFKAQNMSNNAAVCAWGGEIGRAQALQATAAGIEPSVEMNPILIKPEADAYSQVVVNGRVWKSLPAAQYYEHKDFFWRQVTSALDSLSEKYELVIMEGAGSPAELNLKPGDIVNMAVARHVRSPVLLVGDIDRGGIFAQLLGTLLLLDDAERLLVRGLVVNKFRGDPALFTGGVKILEEKSGVPVLGVVPFVKDLLLPEEDAVALDHPARRRNRPVEGVDIAVIRLPHISNFDDFDPLKIEVGVSLRYVHSPETFGEPDAVILPGTKSTFADLDWLRQCGLAEVISAYARNGGSVAGICGGYQVMGEKIIDRLQLESARVESDGLNLLPVVTEWDVEKITRQSTAVLIDWTAWLTELKGTALGGYEIHNGRTRSKTP